MHANMYTRERKYIGSIWSGVTCLALLLATAQSFGSRVLEDSQNRRRLTIATENKQCKQINKQYTKQYLMTKQIVLKDSTHRYECVSTRII
jgi:hypothetical protein